MPALTFLFYHLVLTTKYRRPLLTPAVRAAIARALDDQTRAHRAHVLAFNHGRDLAHLHILVILPPDQPIAAFARDFKSESARLANHDLGRTGRPFWGRRYFAKTVGSGSLDTARRYVAEQWDR